MNKWLIKSQECLAFCYHAHMPSPSWWSHQGQYLAHFKDQIKSTFTWSQTPLEERATNTNTFESHHIHG